MASKDALVLAGDVAALLEDYGIVACGRREDGATRIDFWTHHGKGLRFPVVGTEDETSLLLACLKLANIDVEVRRPPSSMLS